MSELLEVAREAAQAGAARSCCGTSPVRACGPRRNPREPTWSRRPIWASEEAIRAVLAERRPEDVVLGEEGGWCAPMARPLRGRGWGGWRALWSWCGAGCARRRRSRPRVDLRSARWHHQLPLWPACVVRPGGGARCRGCRRRCGDRSARGRDVRRGARWHREARPTATRRPHAAAATRRCAAAWAGADRTGFAYSPQVRAHQGAVVATLIGQVRDERRAGAAALDLVLGCSRTPWMPTTSAPCAPWDIAAGALLCEQVELAVQLPACD